jgi:hypothetical protein
VEAARHPQQPGDGLDQIADEAGGVGRIGRQVEVNDRCDQGRV